jgi:hypothetical protein
MDLASARSIVLNALSKQWPTQSDSDRLPPDHHTAADYAQYQRWIEKVSTRPAVIALARHMRNLARGAGHDQDAA